MNNTWYQTLNKPDYTPQAKIFSIVWAILYTLIFISFMIVFFNDTKINKFYSYVTFFAQMFLNFFWVYCFFKLEKIKISFVVSIMLSLTVMLNIIAFWQISHLAAFLIMPYFIWCCFAMFLNYRILKLNS